jgi:hypothetical protein
MDTNHFASSVVTSWGYKAGDRSCATYIFLHDFHHSSNSFPGVEKKEKMEKQIDRKQEGVVELTGGCLSFPFVSRQSLLFFVAVGRKAVWAWLPL